jgi:hypothetical protein
MQTLDVGGLPEPVVRNLQLLVDTFKEQFSAAKLPPGEGLKQAAGAWADADDAAFARWSAEMRAGRQSEQRRSLDP